MTMLSIPDELADRLRAVAEARGEDLNCYAVTALAEIADRAEGQALLSGPARPAAEVFTQIQEKYGVPDLSHLSREELADQAEAALAALPTEKIAEAERLGLL